MQLNASTWYSKALKELAGSASDSALQEKKEEPVEVTWASRGGLPVSRQVQGEIGS